ncbi:MAG: translation initiation factor IF-2 [Legionellales bacterium]|nr:translation initiation factor IF-2 [Legionellales bacterium]
MAEITVSKLANVIGITADKLLSQLKDAGITVESESSTISDEEKRLLLTHLRKPADGNYEKKKITLKRKSVSKLKIGKASSQKKVVQVEVRRKKTYVPQKLVAEEQQKEPEIIDEKVPVLDATPNKPDEAPKAKQQVKKEAENEKKNKPDTAAKNIQENKKPEKDLSADEKSPVKKEERTVLRTAVKLNRNREFVKKVHAFEKPIAPMVYEVSIPETITVSDLAKKMSIKGTEVIKIMMNLGFMATINQVLDQDTAVLIVEELGHKPIIIQDSDLEEQILGGSKQYDEFPRPPIVTIMGHVDHGKTSLLDYIRRSSVTSSESGGITQHIGAYHVETSRGVITFLDTPGHAAFTAMRARGAEVTDIVIIVVAADDGAKPQTIEAIQHAQSAKIPIIVAVNKIDKPEADPDKVMNELSQHGIMPESWGGENIFVNISALTGENVDTLLDNILLVAEMGELKAVNKGLAKGVVIESKLDKGRGPISTVLVQSGSLKKGDILLAGLQFGKVKAMFDENNKALSEAGPSIPVEVLGLSGVCSAGDDVQAVQDEKIAREVVEIRRNKFRDIQLSNKRKSSLEGLFEHHKNSDRKILNIVLKADVNGSVEALRDALNKLSHDEVQVSIVSYGVGGITESDVNLASASNAIILGFNVRADATAKKLIDFEGISLRYYSIIYDLIDDVKKALSGLLDPEFKEKIVGIADVREVFRSPKYGSIAGCMVTEGFVKRNNPIRVLRDNVVIYEGALESLRRFKEDTNEVRQGMECGIGVKNYNDVKIGDQIEVFETIQVERKI